MSASAEGRFGLYYFTDKLSTFDMRPTHVVSARLEGAYCTTLPSGELARPALQLDLPISFGPNPHSPIPAVELVDKKGMYKPSKYPGAAAFWQWATHITHMNFDPYEVIAFIGRSHATQPQEPQPISVVIAGGRSLMPDFARRMAISETAALDELVQRYINYFNTSDNSALNINFISDLKRLTKSSH